MSGGIDLNKLKEGIADRKKELSVRTNALGETVQVKQTGDQFLSELMHSATTGAVTNASVKVKSVDQLAESKITGKPVDPNLLGHVTASAPTQSIEQPAVNANIPSAADVVKMNEAKRIRERSNTNYNQTMGQTSNAGVADAIAQYTNMGRVGTPMANNNGMLTEQQMMQNQMNMGAPPQLIIEQTQQLLNENFGHLFAEAMKNSIIESYKADVIKTALGENRDVIKEIVVETILDLQKRNQSKK